MSAELSRSEADSPPAAAAAPAGVTAAGGAVSLLEPAAVAAAGGVGGCVIDPTGLASAVGWRCRVLVAAAPAMPLPVPLVLLPPGPLCATSATAASFLAATAARALARGLACSSSSDEGGERGWGIESLPPPDGALLSWLVYCGDARGTAAATRVVSRVGMSSSEVVDSEASSKSSSSKPCMAYSSSCSCSCCAVSPPWIAGEIAGLTGGLSASIRRGRVWLLGASERAVVVGNAKDMSLSEVALLLMLRVDVSSSSSVLNDSSSSPSSA
jgi:hypothetical protein